MLPRSGTQLAGYQAHQRAFAGPVGANQTRDAGAQFQCHLIDTDDRAIPLRDALAQQHRRRGRRPAVSGRRRSSLASRHGARRILAGRRPLTTGRYFTISTARIR